MATGDRSNTPSLEAWAGIECTVNRVGDQYYDQLVRNGHHDRPEDLDLIASLGVRRLRYPVLFERTAPEGLARANWSWPDARLARLERLRLPPIVTLLHHGSGPRFTSLVDDAFPELVAEYAAAVAARYPWVDAYTPINEPLTTARFSGLYGHWYPHGRDEATFLRALVNEGKATVLAMRAIRRITPHAQLIHTEDLGYVHSTELLAYEAEYENERRWLSLDLICGRIDRTHPLYQRLRANGVTDDDLHWFADNPCPPDVAGFNYYITSERFLDENMQRWPAWSHGGNDQHAYADVHSVLAGRLAFVGELLEQAWNRFHLPLAITEAHMGCTREEQLRWLVEEYDAIHAVRDKGIPVVAMTAWSVFGAFDWHCLVTRCENMYEPGLFDVRGMGCNKPPRPTALAAAWRAIASGQRPSHPVLAGRGWWRRAVEGFAKEAAA